METSERKELAKTNLGPEETLEEQEEERLRLELEKAEMREALILQMKAKFESEKEQKEKERERDIENLITAAEVLTGERQKQLEKDRESK